MPTTTNQFRATLRELMLAANIPSVRDLARRTHGAPDGPVSHSTIVRVGQVAPTPATLRSLAWALGAGDDQRSRVLATLREAAGQRETEPPALRWPPEASLLDPSTTRQVQRAVNLLIRIAVGVDEGDAHLAV